MYGAAMTWSLVIRNGLVVDGTGAAPRAADVAIADGRIAAVGHDIGASAEQDASVPVLDARGAIVTPGFVDVHTHYDGQVSWDELLEPSSGHGVTTVVTGNCGVGFAPIRPGTEEWLIQLMEGVEDIPGTALAEGITWGWESFPEYLDHVASRRFAVDVGTQIGHGALRGYVMGERGARNEAATAADIAAMRRLVQEAIEAGALGVSTSRTIGHRARDGEPVPGTYAAEAELVGLGRGLRDGGGGVFELAPAGAAGMEPDRAWAEVDWMTRLAGDLGQPITFASLQVMDSPTLWRDVMAASADAAAKGAPLHPQVAARPFGLLIGLPTHHAFGLRPSYRELADLSHEDRVAELRRPERRAAILAEADAPPDPSEMFAGIATLIQNMLGQLYVLGDPPDYEPGPERTVAAMAAAAGVDPLAMAYELFLDDDGTALLMLPLFNYVDGNHDVIREQLLHPQSISGLGDGGAHCGMICDASITTYLLTHWARDRHRGPGLALEWVVKKQTQDTALLYGLTDRGTIEVGKRADLNVIDHAALRLDKARLVHDLPAGGRRLLQGATGYLATIVAGEVTRRNGVDTGARPGRLVRGTR
jgi:N-acyl-D-aspartate/D-glutamate deacylase